MPCITYLHFALFVCILHCLVASCILQSLLLIKNKCWVTHHIIFYQTTCVQTGAFHIFLSTNITNYFVTFKKQTKLGPSDHSWPCNAATDTVGDPLAWHSQANGWPRSRRKLRSGSYSGRRRRDTPNKSNVSSVSLTSWECASILEQARRATKLRRKIELHVVSQRVPGCFQ